MSDTHIRPASVNECFVHLRHSLFSTSRQLKGLSQKDWKQAFPQPTPRQEQHRLSIAGLLEQVFSDEFYEATQAASPRRIFRAHQQLKVCLPLIATDTFPKFKEMLRHSRALVNLIDEDFTEPQIQCVLAMQHTLWKAQRQLADTALYYRIYQRLVKISPRPFSFDLLLNKHVQGAKKALAGRPISLEFIPPSQPPPLYLDPLWTDLILGRLFANALRFTERGRIRVQFLPEQEQKLIPLVIQDTGLGLAPEDWEDIFQAYSRISTDIRQPELTTYGLSLPISRELARMNGGEIRVWSQVGQGSSFVFLLPAHANPP
jgi:signal transduction histidine kinase